MGTDIEALVSAAIDCGFGIHRELGPGLLESAYEIVLCHRLAKRGIKTERQKSIPIVVDGVIISEGFKADIIVEQVLLLELKSVSRTSDVHTKQLLTYLRFAKLQVGILMNFGAPTFKEGLKRVVNDYRP